MKTGIWSTKNTKGYEKRGVAVQVARGRGVWRDRKNAVILSLRGISDLRGQRWCGALTFGIPTTSVHGKSEILRKLRMTGAFGAPAALGAARSPRSFRVLSCFSWAKIRWLRLCRFGRITGGAL